MSLKLSILTLSERLKWKNWPIWLKGFFLLWPSIGPAYLFIMKNLTLVGSEEGLSTLMANVEYLNYFIVVFLGFWSINLILLGLTWIIGGLISDTYRSFLIEKSRTMKNNSLIKQVPGTPKKQVRKYPVLVKKGTSKEMASKPKTVKRIYPVLRKKNSSAKTVK